MRLLLALLLAASAHAQTMDVHVRQSGAFNPNGGGLGVISGVVDLRTTVQFPEGRTVSVGGFDRGMGASTSTSPGGRTSRSSSGGGTYTGITVTEVPVITGPVAHPLPGVRGRELVTLLESGAADDRLSAARELGRRAWTPRARTFLTRRLSSLLADPEPAVAGGAARAIGDLGDPEATPILVGYLKGRSPDRLVPILEALGRAGDARALAPVERMTQSIDLEISVAARRAADTLERRLARAAAPNAPAR